MRTPSKGSRDLPEVHFGVRWPDHSATVCYSPSTVIRDFLAPGQSYPVAEFVGRCTRALAAASDRVRARHGFACGRAAAQAAQIEAKGLGYDNLPEARVLVEWMAE